ncbi:MAG: hypothetical protein JWP63_6431, partial [Candidatus Solibacter sp.]|nr:hypothetical protein [Candidatus Solibacter sp.]
MSKAYVLNQLKHGGTASIVATVKPHCRTHEHLARLEQHFRDRRDLGDAGPNMLYLEKLGVIVGEVDREGWDKLQKSAALSEVTGPPPLRPVTGLGSDAPLETAPKVS